MTRVTVSFFFWEICKSLSLLQLLCLTQNNCYVDAFTFTYRCPKLMNRRGLDLPFFSSGYNNWNDDAMNGFPLFSSSSNDDYRNNLDVMRSILESSWNSATMGSVPTTPDSAAEAAALAVSQAMEDSENNSGIYLVDILLPSMDVSQQEVYDGLSAVEFCIALSRTLHRIRSSDHNDNNKNNQPQSAIFMNNNAMLQSIKSQLEIKQQKEADTINTNNNNIDTSSTIFQLEDKNEDFEDDEIVAFDDFSDFEGINSLSLYDESEDHDMPTTELNQNENENKYQEPFRLGSLFGDATIRRGPKMMNQVFEALDKNVVMEPNENVLILLSPTTQEEMIAVRSLVTKYNTSSGSNKKVIIIINNKLNPTPRELLLADTVYSMLPLIARASSSTPQQVKDTQPAPPKIVLMRRYPNDWQVFIDSNNSGEKSGFQLAGSTPAHSVGKRGPSMDFIADCVKRYMSLKYGTN
jgi:hypothetical protein